MALNGLRVNISTASRWSLQRVWVSRLVVFLPLPSGAQIFGMDQTSDKRLVYSNQISGFGCTFQGDLIGEINEGQGDELELDDGESQKSSAPILVFKPKRTIHP